MDERIDDESGIARQAWATVREDPLATAAVAAFVVAAPVGLVPWLTAAQKELVVYSVLPLVFLGLAVAALRWRRDRLARREERRFWDDLTVAFGAWLGVRILFLFFPGGGRPLAAELLAETLYAVFYAAFVLALERQPHRTDRWRPSGLEGTLVRPAVAVFVLGLAVYFVLIPASIDRASYESLLPSMVFYLTLDVFLVARSLRLVRAASRDGRPDRRWRAIYSGLALVAMLALASDVVEYLDYRGGPGPGGIAVPPALEPLWNLVFVALAVTARLRHRRFPGRRSRRSSEVPEEAYVPGPSAQTLVFALAFPWLHLACYSWGVFGTAGSAAAGPELAREIVVLAAIVVLGAIAFVQHRLFSRRTRELAQQRSQMETALRKSDSSLQLQEQRRATHRELRQAEDEFLAFFRLGPGNRLIYRLADGRVIEVNDNLAHAVGRRREEIAGAAVEDLFRWSAPAQRAAVSAALRSGEAVRDLELELLAGSEAPHRGDEPALRHGALLAAEPIDFGGEPCLLAVLCSVPKGWGEEDGNRGAGAER